MKGFLLSLSLLLVSTAFADNNTSCSNNSNCYDSSVYVYEGSQDLIDLYTMSGTTNLNSGDDQWSNAVDFGFTWSRWDESWSKARMSTNGCVNLTGNSGHSSSNCQDYTPQSLPYRQYTLYPFWTDLIRGTASGGQTSKMLFKAFDDYVVFGWYYLREYQRSSSNSFEAILYDNNSYEYRYRELDIINHDVVIGEQGSSSETETFLYYNDGQSGYATLDAYLAGYGGPDIENGGSLYSGTLSEMCGINALYSTECSGYAAAYLAQQCELSALYSESCSGYAVAYFNQQCGLNTLYDEDCTGYAVAKLLYECNLDVFYSSSCDGYASALAQEEALNAAIYGTEDESYGYTNEYDEYGMTEEDYYGYTDEDMWYDAEYDEYLDPSDPCYENACENFTDADWYALDIEQFGQEQVDEWYGQDVQFSDEGYMDYEQYGTTEEEFFSALDTNMDQYDAEQEAIWAAEELAWQEQQQMLEVVVEVLDEYLTDAEWYEIDLEEFGQEQVDEWYGEEVSFDEEGFIPETYWEELYEEEVYANIVEDIYILEETIGVEIFQEEEWSTDEVLEIYEEVLEDYELEALEDHEEEIFEEFEEEYDEEELFMEEDEAFEDLIDEAELEELLSEEVEEQEAFEEEFEEEQEEQETAFSPE